MMANSAAIHNARIGDGELGNEPGYCPHRGSASRNACSKAIVEAFAAQKHLTQRAVAMQHCTAIKTLHPAQQANAGRCAAFQLAKAAPRPSFVGL
jgi:hypothetical protein